MGDASLSQEEIDALLMGADDMGGEGADAGMGATSGGMQQNEKNSLASAFNEAMVSVSSAAGSMVGKKVAISGAFVEEIDSGMVSTQIDPGSVIVSVSLGANHSMLVFAQNQAKKIAAAMMGSDSEPDILDEAHLSTISELSNTILSTLANNLGSKFSDSLTPSIPEVSIYSSPADLPVFNTPTTVKISYQLNVDGSSGQLQHFIESGGPASWARALSSSAQPAAPAAPRGGFAAPTGGMQAGQMMGGTQVNPVSYPTFQNTTGTQLPPNLDILMDVQMVLTVELGRTKKYVKDIFQLGEGSIIELDKLAGEPVDLLVNGKLIAKGEVVVIDENFGVRVTDIVGPAERMAKISGQ